MGAKPPEPTESIEWYGSVINYEAKIKEKNKEQERIIMQKQHAANLKSMDYVEKNKQVLGHFLRLT